MEEDAQAYDELNQPQTEVGCKFVRKLNLSQGAKVLDMGCGTGSVTKYISDIVGPDGQVVGIDPDATRIKIAQEKYKEISNLQFYVGSSATRFPHDNEPYYDAHISTESFHWVPNDEKKIYIQKAHQCLKSGGKLAILCGEKVLENVPVPNLCPLTQDGYQKIFQEVGVFPDFVVEREPLMVMKLKSFEEFKRWWKASSHRDFDEMNQGFVQEMMRDLLTTSDDGHVILSTPGLHITATKR